MTFPTQDDRLLFSHRSVLTYIRQHDPSSVEEISLSRNIPLDDAKICVIDLMQWGYIEPVFKNGLWQYRSPHARYL